MLAPPCQSKTARLGVGLVLGVAFGFCLQKGGVTTYQVIMDQLLLRDFTVVKVMLSAAIVGMVGAYAMRDLGWVSLHPKPGSWSMNVIGGLVFGVGFGVLGYCPGTAMGAAGQGSLDALCGGVVGITLGAGLFAAVYPRLKRHLLDKGDFGAATFPSLLTVHHWLVIVPLATLMMLVLVCLERLG